MLTIAIEDQHELPLRPSQTGLDCGPVAFVVRMTEHTRASPFCLSTRLVIRAVVDDQDLVPCCRIAERVYNLTDDGGLVVRRDDDRG